MIDFDPDHVLGVGEHFVDDDPRSIREQREADAEFIRALTALERRKRRERIVHDLAVVKAAQKAGLTVTRAPIDGVALEFGQPEPAKAAPDDEVEAWIRKQGPPQHAN